MCFSALQRAENSSIDALRALSLEEYVVSVLFSEPKIPQSYFRGGEPLPIMVFQCSSASRKFLNCLWIRRATRAAKVSVLFSEPKIPQLRAVWLTVARDDCFSALQRAENSSIVQFVTALVVRLCFSALQRAENSSIF